ncbi:MAG: hypothetical protein LBH81_00820 [Rickettsiales bacterium]|jgi:hypothetical protein|nr:hypothetical protein [Rickettsiales bacterium]
MRKLAQLITLAVVCSFGTAQVSAEPMQMDYYPQGVESNSPRSQRAVQAGGGRGLDSRATGDVREEIEGVVSGTRGRAAANTGTRTGAATARTAVRTSQMATAGQVASGTAAAPQARSRGQANVSPRSGTQRTTAGQPAGAATGRTVAARGGQTARSATNPQARTMNARSATTARASLSGNPMAGSTTTNMARAGANLYGSVMYNLVDETTGGLSQSAYDECLNNYYMCMDEICAARSPGMRRCACSNRVNAYTKLEEDLAKNRETILKLSSQLQMLETTRGGEITSAFQLTEAELTLNCVSFRDAYQRQNYQGEKDAMENWCNNHNFGNSYSVAGIGNNLTQCKALGSAGPQYCVDMLGNRGAASLDGNDSDIISQLRNIADSVSTSNFLIADNANDWFSNLYNNNNIYGNAFNAMDNTCQAGWQKNEQDTCMPMTDVLDLWGEDLFNFAHNSVCKRILDNCFNGICGWAVANPNDLSQGLDIPANPQIDKDCWDKQIRLTNNVVTGGRGQTSANQQSQAYTKNNDQFFGLRAPITQARFSIKQKFHFDANADCDVFGEELKTQTRNMSLQMVAAEEMLKRKRLEFAEEKVSKESTELAAAQKSMITCLDQITNCHESYKCKTKEGTACIEYNTPMFVRGKCNAMVEIPACYQQMVCDSGAKRVIAADSTAKTKEGQNEIVTTTHRNVVTLMEILYGLEYPANFENKTPATHPAETCLDYQPMVQSIRCVSKASTNDAVGMCSQ